MASQTVSTLVSLLTPFGIYLLAEHFYCSGILSAVASGITISYLEQSGQVLPVTRVRRSAVWDLIQFAANGVIFVLLGEQLPRLFNRATRVVNKTGHHESVWLILYIVGVSLALAVLRCVGLDLVAIHTVASRTQRPESLPTELATHRGHPAPDAASAANSCRQKG